VNSRFALWAALALLALALAGCGQAPPETETRHRFMAMGTLVDVTIRGVPEVEAETAAREVEALFQALHHEWDPWGDGALGQVNRALAAGEPATPDPDLAALLAQAAALTSASGGRFDPAVGAVVRLWGFSSDELRREAPPPPEQIATLLRGTRPLPALLDPDGHRVTGPPGAQLDLGAFLKGVAVDRGVELLQARGIDRAIVNAGGDLRAIGRPDDRAWRVGVRDPRGPDVLAAIEIEEDEAVFTSGDYERYFDHEGQRYHHVLDPRTGYPARGVAAVTVLHPDARLADAAATALMVAGPEEWPAVARALGIEHALVVLEQGGIELTPAMHSRARFLEERNATTARVRELP
jgi:FAD:protein FMN transferase